ncbi:MAG: hemerythrin domain-containing protein [Burkholderiales bacterium]|nr:hemerythrin domain-containing protein [Burkholderiales bacterium]
MSTRASTALPGFAAPAAGYDQPFEMLEACHERVERSLGLLQRLLAHLQARGFVADEQARDAARDVMRYFDRAAPEHHADEERHVFPLARTLREPAVDAAIDRLQQDHLVFHERWLRVREGLTQIAQATDRPALGPHEAESFAQQAAAFAHGYPAHMAAEHDTVFPAAQRALAAQASAPRRLREMGDEMAGRRGAIRPPAGDTPRG